jgi:hypothetical protein
MVVMRDAKTRRALGLSYSEDGLKLTANKSGRLIYYNRAVIRPINGKVTVVGDLRISPRIIVEPYKRENHKSYAENNYEEFWACKAKHLATYY